MNFLSSCFFLSFIFYFLFLQIDAYKNNIRFNSVSNGASKNISEDLKQLSSINEELINNEIEDEEDEEDEDDKDSDEVKGDFDVMAHEALQHAEEQGVVDLENAEIDDLLDNELFKIIQERLKKLWYIGRCRRDYSSLCPLDWKKSAYDENLCIPPQTYEGQCRSLDFSNTTEKQKENFAWRCEVEWPCVSAPRIKATEKCPLRWINSGGNLCISPEDYVGQCPPAIDFSDYTFEMKMRKAIQCDFQWPVEKKQENVFQNYRSYRGGYGGPVEESGNVKKTKHV